MIEPVTLLAKRAWGIKSKSSFRLRLTRRIHQNDTPVVTSNMVRYFEFVSSSITTLSASPSSVWKYCQDRLPAFPTPGLCQLSGPSHFLFLLPKFSLRRTGEIRRLHPL
jgi:hypothetical protein